MSWEVYSEIEERVLGSLFVKWGEYPGIFIQRLKSLCWGVYSEIEERVLGSLFTN
jgi:hypothetical protein